MEGVIQLFIFIIIAIIGSIRGHGGKPFLLILAYWILAWLTLLIGVSPSDIDLFIDLLILGGLLYFAIKKA